MRRERITYFAAAAPTSRRTAGLIKVGISRDPDRRARYLSTRLIGTTTMPEFPIRQMLAPFAATPDEMRSRGFGLGDGLGEWVYDTPAVRAFAAWVCENHPVEDAESDADLHDEPSAAIG
jgi:hypothetical protein